MIDTEGLIQEYGDQAYWKAIDFIVIATHCKDAEGAEHFAACARDLLKRGYHKHSKKEEKKE